MRKNHSMRVCSEFVVFEWHSYFFLKKKMKITSECVSNFENCNSGWFCFISAKCDGGFKKVRCTRDIVQSFFSNKVINRCNELDQSAVDATSINAFKLIRESQE